MDTNALKFSGHESFHCRTFWLKKGYEFVQTQNTFPEEAGIELGVGRNMVGSLRFWLRAFGIVDKNNHSSELAQRLLADDGWDPYIEDEATLWLLHFELVKRNYASVYNIIFTELRKQKPDFSKKHFVQHALELDSKLNENTLDKDFMVFTHTYYAKTSGDKEESFSGLLHELGLLKVSDETAKSYHIANSRQESIPAHIVLYGILAGEEFENSVSVKTLLSPGNSIGNIFAFNPEGLENKLIEITTLYEDIVYRNDAGVKELQFKGPKPEALTILAHYYGN